MYSTQRRSAPCLVLIVFGLFISGASHAMSILDGQLPLQNPWKERFQDVTKLNDFAKTHPVEITNAKIENENIDGAILNGGKFENSNWKKVSAKNASLAKVVFSKGIIEDVDFSDSILTDVVFEDINLRGLRFFRATLHNVKFIRCTFNGINLDQTKNSQIEVNDSKAISTSFSEGQLIAVFRNSKLYDGVELTDLQPPSSLTFEKSELIQVNLERSKLQSLIIEDTKFDAVLDAGSAESVTIRNSSVDTSFSAATIGTLSMINTSVTKLSFNKAKAKSLVFKNCPKLVDFVMYGTTIDTLEIDHTQVSDFYPAVSNIGVLQVVNSTITKAGFERFKAKSLIFNNVTLDGKIDFTGAHVDKLETHNITKQPGLNLITTGSNVHLE